MCVGSLQNDEECRFHGHFACIKKALSVGLAGSTVQEPQLDGLLSVVQN